MAKALEITFVEGMTFDLGEQNLRDRELWPWDMIALKDRMISLGLLFKIPKNHTYAEKCET